LTFEQAIRSGFDHYTKFDGRANRPAFWYWFLFEIAVIVVAEVIGAIIGTSILYYLAALGLLLPGLSVSIRRLHDTNRSGWWILIGIIPLIGFIVLLIFYCEQSNPGDNDYGPPMAESGAPAPAAA
jgi:uncharacterized membrane protein YhaH (DUF805 family)